MRAETDWASGLLRVALLDLSDGFVQQVPSDVEARTGRYCFQEGYDLAGGLATDAERSQDHADRPMDAKAQAFGGEPRSGVIGQE